MILMLIGAPSARTWAQSQRGPGPQAGPAYSHRHTRRDDRSPHTPHARHRGRGPVRGGVRAATGPSSELDQEFEVSRTLF